jgi:hypothetical protein
MGKSSRITAWLHEDIGSWNIMWKRVAMEAAGVTGDGCGALDEGCHLFSMTRLACFSGLGSRSATRDEVLHWNARDTEERRRLDEWRFERQPEAGNEVLDRGGHTIGELATGVEARMVGGGTMFHPFFCTRMLQVFQTHVSSVSSVFFYMLQVLHLDVLEVDRDVAHVAIVFQLYVPNVSSVLDVCYKFFIWMLQK